MKNFYKDLSQTKKEFKFYKIRNQKNFNSNFSSLKNKIFIDFFIITKLYY